MSDAEDDAHATPAAPREVFRPLLAGAARAHALEELSRCMGILLRTRTSTGDVSFTFTGDDLEEKAHKCAARRGAARR